MMRSTQHDHVILLADDGALKPPCYRCIFCGKLAKSTECKT